ncbi:hypothetical protein MWU49_13105 [Alcanivorax sp. S6407]|uniref:hypothetical protein n=1 Tax=Alcanivorax sp. S6407 TaxID=2926424 RepID=UPI001FF13A06|nr:hypothetical protein [Alcanivorax sp. S6407]MCK0154651.1 hypothetical protein [Alcanivorax sp. S6407]
MRRQRGALTVLTPLLLLVIIILSVMALDGARLYSLRGEMQAQVNVAAQAGASATQSCGGLAPSSALIRQRALAAAQAQGYAGEDEALTVSTGVIEVPGGDNVLAFRPVNFIEESNAVLVSYTRNEPISLLLPESVFGTLDITVNAAARKEVTATLSAAGSTASVDAGIVGALLGAVLGDPGYVLDPTDLDSLRNTTVELGELLTELGVADVAELLTLDGQELAAGLRDVAGVASPLGQVLDDLLAANGISTVQVSEVLDVVEGTQVPVDSEFPLYDLVISLVLNVAETQQDAAGGFLDVPLDLNLNTGLANVVATTDLRVGEPPRVVVGPARQDADGNWRTRFYAPDVSLRLNAEIDLLPLGLINVATLSLPLAVNAGGAEGAFVGARCATGTRNDVAVILDLERSIARLGSGSIDPDNGEIIPQSVSLSVLSSALLPITVLEADLTVAGEVPGVTENNVVISDDYPLYCDAADGCYSDEYTDTGDGVSGLDLDVDLSNVTVGTLPIGVALVPLQNTLESVLGDVVEGLAVALVNPLLEALGVGLGGVTVTLSNATQGGSQVIENVPVVMGN